MTLIDLTRQRFGKLVVTGSYHKKNPSGTDEIFWVCACDCGGSKDVRGFSLRCGDTTSCGCVQLETVRAIRGESIIGRVFGRLTVKNRVSKIIGKRNTHVYECSCACGNMTPVQRSHLVSGTTQSCGCLRREMIAETVYLPRNVAAWNYIKSDLVKSAKDRDLELDLTDSEIELLVFSDCYYCGDAPSREVRQMINMHKPSTVKFTGIDRIDSSIGYIASNVVSCCTQCNYGKSTYSIESFIEMCHKVATNHPRPIRQEVLKEAALP